MRVRPLVPLARRGKIIPFLKAIAYLERTKVSRFRSPHLNLRASRFLKSQGKMLTLSFWLVVASLVFRETLALSSFAGVNHYFLAVLDSTTQRNVIQKIVNGNANVIRTFSECAYIFSRLIILTGYSGALA